MNAQRAMPILLYMAPVPNFGQSQWGDGTEPVLEFHAGNILAIINITIFKILSHFCLERDSACVLCQICQVMKEKVVRIANHNMHIR